MKEYQPHLSSLGSMKANNLAVLCGLAVLILPSFLGPLLCIIVFATEKKSGLVKYYSMAFIVQFIIFQVLDWILNAINGTLTFFGGWFSMFNWGRFAVLSTIIGLFGAVQVVLVIVMMVKAHRYQQWDIPLIGGLVEGLAKAGNPPAYNGDGPVPPEAAPYSAESYASQQQPGYPGPGQYPGAAPGQQPGAPGQYPGTNASPGQPQGYTAPGAPVPPASPQPGGPAQYPGAAQPVQPYGQPAPQPYAQPTAQPYAPQPGQPPQPGVQQPVAPGSVYAPQGYAQPQDPNQKEQ